MDTMLNGRDVSSLYLTDYNQSALLFGVYESKLSYLDTNSTCTAWTHLREISCQNVKIVPSVTQKITYPPFAGMQFNNVYYTFRKILYNLIKMSLKIGKMSLHLTLTNILKFNY